MEKFVISETQLKKISSVRLKDGRTFNLGQYLGEGEFSYVYTLKPHHEIIIKIPKNPTSLLTFRSEIVNELKLKRIKVLTAVILNSEDLKPNYLLKERIFGKNAQEIIDTSGLNDEQIKDLAQIFLKSYHAKMPLDINYAENFIWEPLQKRFVLVDNYFIEQVNIKEWYDCFFRNNEDSLDKFISFIGRTKVIEIENNFHKIEESRHAMGHMPIGMWM